MRPSPSLAVGCALLLTVSFGLGAAWLLWKHVPRPRASAQLLTEKERRALKSYKQRCKRREDCARPLECVDDLRMLSNRCLGSECLTDADCAPDTQCRAVHSLGGLPVRLCIVKGVRKEGEVCHPLLDWREAACEPGLVCHSRHCGRPCRLEDPEACRAGSVCVDDINGPVCAPSCVRTGCPEGKRCVRFEGDYSVCGVVRGEDCESHPCPLGYRCRKDTSPTGVILMQCEIPCAEDNTCPRGLECFLKRCNRPCNPDDTSACGPHEKCQGFLGPVYYCTLQLDELPEDPGRRFEPSDAGQRP